MTAPLSVISALDAPPTWATVPDSIRADATVVSHLESMQHGIRWFLGAGGYSTFDLVYVQTYDGAYQELQEPTPHESLRIGAYGGSR